MCPKESSADQLLYSVSRHNCVLFREFKLKSNSDYCDSNPISILLSPKSRAQTQTKPKILPQTLLFSCSNYTVYVEKRAHMLMSNTFIPRFISCASEKSIILSDFLFSRIFLYSSPPPPPSSNCALKLNLKKGQVLGVIILKSVI